MAIALTPDNPGHWMAGADGSVHAFGNASGGLMRQPANWDVPVAGIASTQKTCLGLGACRLGSAAGPGRVPPTFKGPPGTRPRAVLDSYQPRARLPAGDGRARSWAFAVFGHSGLGRQEDDRYRQGGGDPCPRGRPEGVAAHADFGVTSKLRRVQKKS